MTRSRRPILEVWLAGALLGAIHAASMSGFSRADDGPAAPIDADIVLRGGTLVDGTGADRRTGDVAFKGDRIVAVGTFVAGPGARVLDVSGLIVAPGFIDLHTHSDEGIARERTRANINYATQGVTTIVTGNCGDGVLDAAAYFAAIDAHGAGSNVIHLVPHGSVRSRIMGNAERAPTPAEFDRMRQLVERNMKAGAWGISTGLIYVPGRYARTDELIALARVAGEHGGIYASHIRSEGAGLLAAIDEAIAVGEGANIPVHISHLKASGKPYWGTVKGAIERIERARAAGRRVSADQYPYIASSTKLAAMVVPHWAARVDGNAFSRLAADQERGALLRREIARELSERDGGASVRIARYAPRPEWAGQDLVSIAGRAGTTPLEVVLEIQRHGGAQAISFGMCEEDVREVMKYPFVATASDGSTHLPGGGDQPHPRAYGTFPRKIRYALDDHVLTLEQAIRSCSGWPAEILGLADRGVLRAGAFADIAVFDPATFRDSATFDRPTQYATGLRHLFVNGVALIADGHPRLSPGPAPGGKLPGRAMRLHRDGPAALIIKAGRIWTGDTAHPWAQALAARDGVIAAVGTEAEVLRLRGPATRLIDRPGAFAIPGLIDAHGHMESLGAAQEEVDLRGAASLDEVARRVKERMARARQGAWITGRSWDQSLWPGGAFPTAAALDAVAPDRPVWLRRVDGHAGWANTEAMRRAGITRDTPAPPGGQILKDEHGNPSGVFVDAAMHLVGRVVSDTSGVNVRQRLLAAQDLALRSGLTGVHDAGVSPRTADAYRELDREGKLKIRIYAMASPPGRNPVSFVGQRPRANPEGARFELRAIKLFIDGAMGSRGALLFAPYADDPGNTGLVRIDPQALEAVTTEALRHGWQVATHAIGDKGNALVLDAYAAARKTVPEARDPRLRIEHAQVVRKEDVARFAELRVIASMQPSHASSDLRWAEARLGPLRVDGAYAWRWFLGAGVPLAFGSDFPVEIVSPFWGLYAAVTRQDAEGRPPGGWHPEHRLTLEEALRAHTAGSAYAAFGEERVGVLKSGLRADLTVVDRDLFRASPAELLATRVVMTIIDGEPVFEQPDP